MRTVGDRAVVLGGSIAGLLAARVLAEAHAEVVVVERDELADGAPHQRGAPQSQHIHGLLAGLQQARKELFDGLTAELVEPPCRPATCSNTSGLCFGGSPTATRLLGPAGAAAEPAIARGPPARKGAHADSRGASWTAATSPD